MSLLSIDSTRKITSTTPYQRSYTFAEIYHKGRYDIPKMIDFLKR